MNEVKEADKDVTGSKSKPHTPAYASFETNTDKLHYFLSFGTRAVQSLVDELRDKLSPDITASLNELRDKATSDRDVETGEKSNDLIVRIVDRVKRFVEQFTGGYAATRQWLPVMLVTIVEAYLIDVLVYAAKTDPSIMKSSNQSASYGQVRQAQSLEHLIEELRFRWARNFVDDGGPDRWIKKLSRMGARGYRSQTAEEMETLWGIRHLIIHTAGVVTQDFVRRHPNMSLKVGENFPIHTGQFRGWIEVIYHFVDVTDLYFVERLRNKRESC
jgi:hypothetical protein